MRAEDEPVLILFAREPVPGGAKTRLAGELGADGAARLAARMIDWTIDNAVRHWPGPVRLAVWPPSSEPRLMAKVSLPVCAQRGENLGERMANAIADAGGPAAVVGCDVPHLDGGVLTEAASLLRAGKNVVGPAEDGGFYLVGLACDLPGLFEDIAWGAEDVYRRLLRNAARRGADLVGLPRLRDIDRAEDLDAVRRVFAPLARFLDDSTGAAHG